MAIINNNPGFLPQGVGGAGMQNPLQMILQLLVGLIGGLMGGVLGGLGGGGGGFPASPNANFGGQPFPGGPGGFPGGPGGCPGGGFGNNLGNFLGCPCHGGGFPGQAPFCPPQHHGPHHHHHHGPGVAGGAPGGVPQSTGNPKDWYFKHGKYETQKTDYGHVQFDGNTRVEYNKEAKTGYVYGKVEGQWQLKEVRKDWGGKAASPVMLDMDGNNRPDVAGGEWKPHAGKDVGAQKVNFDLNGDGKKEVTEWTGGKDGLLLNLSPEQQKAYQQNGRLEVSGKEMYGDQGGKYADGYDKMRKVSDANRDGKLSGAELNNHYVWQDANRDAIVNQGELRSTKDAGITSVNATHDGNYQSTFEQNGQQKKSWDWWPTTWG
ncbi:MAG: hypothetical protein HY319_06430 [Armatimonadetes bacterium]|nr:hypothetical protein [Armatimonadota bacterium]